LLINELRFRSPPLLWHSNSSRALHWGDDLIKGNFEPWKEFKRYSGQVSAAIFYPSAERGFDFLLCINKYTPVALTRILDVRYHSAEKLETICSVIGLKFEYSSSRPILLPIEPESCMLVDVKNFIKNIEQFKRKVRCSIQELGEFFRFI